MMPNGMNMDPAMIRQSMNMMRNMTDEQLQSYIAATGRVQKNFLIELGMNISPQLMRQQMSMMDNMNEDQVKDMAQKAQEMQKSGFLPNGQPFPKYGQPPGNFQIPAPQPTAVKDENLDVIENFKSIGNQKFKQGDYGKALHYYNQGLEETKDLIGQYIEKNSPVNHLIKVKTQIQLNISFCYQKQEKWEESLKLLEKILKIERHYGKAWYRKAVTLESLKRIPEALESAGTALNCATPDQIKSKELRLQFYLKKSD